MPHVPTKFGSILTVALCVVLVGCGSSPNLPNDDLGYDPAIRDLDAAAPSVFDPMGLPVGATGAPLRGVPVEGEWTMYLGNQERTGTRLARGIAEPVIRWSVSVGIQGYANTPLVGGDYIFASSQGSLHNESDPDDGFYALDPQDGSQAWFYATNEDVNGASLTADFVVGGTDDGTLYAIERSTGDKAWEIELSSPLRHGPLVDGDILRVQLERGFVEIDARDGRTVQRSAGEPDGYDVRGALAQSGDNVYRASRACSLEAYEDGNNAWSRTTCTPSSEEWRRAATYAPPTVIGGALVVLSPEEMDYDVASTSLAVIVREDGSELWMAEPESRQPTDPFASQSYEQGFMAAGAWLMNGVIFVPRVGAADLLGYDLASGEVRLRVDMPDCRSRQFASIVGVPSRGYFPRHDGRLYAFIPATGEIAWALSLQYAASAAIVQNDSLSWNANNGYCHADPWDGSALFATPAIGEDGTLYVGSGEGTLYAIEDANW
ncbi:MAG: outer membrane protein assembly factor BamB [Bradymonadia bacterium]|jgi:outer membrane protein assembly factor BamB